MGLVFAAEATTSLSGGSGKYPIDARSFAVKMLRPEFLTDTEVLGRFLEEGRTCQRLIHPNILRVFETAQAEDGTPYLVMELLDGVPLSAYTANGGRVPLQQAIAILQGILAGLAAAHAQGIVHRDLKPENVFLAREANGQFQIKLLDFGIAKVMDAAGGMGSRTRTGALLGTPAYMSPEQVKDPRNVDPRSDLWSAAIMTWEMLSGRVAFPAPTEYARLTAVTTFTPDTLAKVDPQLAPISPVVERAMQKDPALRFASALEMARALPNLTGSTSAPSARPPEGYTNPNPTPLSRLPAVPSIFGPGSSISPGASSERRTPASPTSTSRSTPRAPAPAARSRAPPRPRSTRRSRRACSCSTPPPARRCRRTISRCSIPRASAVLGAADRGVGRGDPRRRRRWRRASCWASPSRVRCRAAGGAWLFARARSRGAPMADLDPTLDVRYLEVFPSFLRTLGDDAGALGALAGSDAPEPVRRYVVAGLNYIFKSLDLIPDGIDDLGFLDDAFVLRVAASLAASEAPESASIEPLARLATDAGQVKAFLGDVYPKIEAYVKNLLRGAARGRTVEDIVGDEATRATFLQEVAAWGKAYQVPSFTRDIKTLIKLKAFLSAKLIVAAFRRYRADAGGFPGSATVQVDVRTRRDRLSEAILRSGRPHSLSCVAGLSSGMRARASTSATGSPARATPGRPAASLLTRRRRASRSSGLAGDRAPPASPSGGSEGGSRPR